MHNDKKWYQSPGPSSDVVCSTRVRLARNLRRYPFPQCAGLQQKEEIGKLVSQALQNSILSSEFRFLPLNQLSREQAVSLVERHLVSPAFVADSAGKEVLLSADESISIMVNEEDHLRIQVLSSGLSLREAAQTADRIDTLLGEQLDFAFDPELGYLTQCPTNIGTGMRASLMLHLPALQESGAMPRIASNLSKLGLTVRGTYGEGTQVTGALYQLSNQITLGLSEQEAIDNLLSLADQLLQEEKKLREKLCGSIAVQDRIERAAGVLKSAKMLSGTEYTELMSLVRLGVSAGLLKGISPSEIDALTMQVQPATLMAEQGRALEQQERDILRAGKVRGTLQTLQDAAIIT